MGDLFKGHLFVLILCGGGGTRLWPRSRQKTPKQFLPNFFGKKTIFTQTVERAALLTTSEKIFVITNATYVDEVVEQGKLLSLRNVIAEPQGKNTAMAMGAGAAYIRKADPKAIIVNLASDQIVGEEKQFLEQIKSACQAALLDDYLVTVGIKPIFPHTGLGYIEAGEEIALGGKKIFKAVSFKEKPDFQTAQKFVSSGRFFWNANMYVWSATSIFNAFSKYSSAIFEWLKKISQAIGKENEKEVFNEAYENVENISIDYAISEKADNLLLVPASFSWSDIGDWKVVYELKKKEEEENVVEIFGEKGWHLGVDTKGCLIEAEERLIATVGVSDLVIVETKDAVLICSKQKAQDVKKIVENLKEKGKEDFL